MIQDHLFPSEEVNHYSEAELPHDSSDSARHLDVDVDVRGQSRGVRIVHVAEQYIDEIDSEKVVGVGKTI